MDQPETAHVVRLRYRDMQPKYKVDANALIVEFRALDGEIYQHELPNDKWLVQCPALQFMAVNGFKPSDIKGTSMNVEDWNLIIPVVSEGGEYGLAASIFANGESALRRADWFSADDSTKDDDGSGGPSAGGSPDPGTGNRGAVDMNMAEEDSDAGVEVKIS